MSQCRCGRPNRDTTTFCETCRSDFARALGDVAWLDDELDTTIARQRAVAPTGGAPSATTPLPWHERAADVKRDLHNLLVLWVRLCHEEGVGRGPSRLPVDRNPALARWLMWRVDGLAQHDAGPDAVEEITNAVAQAERIVFWKRKNRVYLGPCAYGAGLADQLSDCPGDVYADEDEPVGHCEECERGVTVVIRQTQLDDDLHSRLLSAADIADWSVRMGLKATREQVRKRVLYWHRHKRINPHAHDARGDVKVPLFRYGDVRHLLVREYAQSDTA